MSIRQQEWCPWGCGQRTAEHMAGIPCPPSTASGIWKNGSATALGATEQLKDDLKELRETQKALGCTSCKNVLQRRIIVFEQELARRP